ncbi:hypothetical protein [Labedaea rhizosphaerae]|uniref:Uncharacterized protein n=1 Tax=Labedaea rhizosphaerae TaxID=598644 RepID=A0A4R6SF03_LABRH|nr:hypothetical protein [Labedaea rhizosphaerae]TDQ00253.1 hypothetical protein EV186_102114 [Labedaea rhizosphaerae]
MTASDATRRSLHGIAELLLAGPQYRASTEIALRVTADGFATTAEPDLRFDGVAVVHGDRRVAVAGLSYADVADGLGVVAGRPQDLYPDGSNARPADVISLDPAAVRALVAAFVAGDEALRRFAPEERPVLWPEHFDVGITVGDVNYGLAPGDDQLPEPYAYVGPHTPRTGEFWNMPFGAAKPLHAFADVAAIVAFFETGRRLAAAAPADDKNH